MEFILVVPDPLPHRLAVSFFFSAPNLFALSPRSERLE